MTIFMLRRVFRSGMLAVMLLCATPAIAGSGPTAKTTPARLLDEANRVMFSDHARFLVLLDQLHRSDTHLTPEQQQQTTLLDAFKTHLEGHDSRAVQLYISILDHPVNPVIGVRARARLIALYLLQRQYVKAYELANALMERLPRISDPKVRSLALIIIIRVLDGQDRYDDAIKYTRLLEAQTLSDTDRCVARVFRTQERIYRGDTIAAARTEYLDAIRTCRSANMSAYANGLREVWASEMVEEGHPDRAIAYLDRIKPATIRSGSRQHIAAVHVVYAEAYLKKGRYRRARAYALKVLAGNTPGSFNWTLQYAYAFLYRIDKHLGRYSSALRMRQRYLRQYQAAADDAKAQAIAFQRVRQDVLTNQLQRRELSRKNQIMQLRQSLDRTSAETNRLYIALLLLVLASVAFWAWRIKHSQVRFRRLARHDDLTGTFNRQHFFDQAEHTLSRLRKEGGQACLLILDMDHFKRINDAHGHVAGDCVLKHVARTCREQLRDSDVFGRLGGEEFGILMPGCSIPRGTDIGERIRRSLAQSPVAIHLSETVTVTCSIGLAATRDHGHALSDLLIAADEALYAAKRDGRNTLATHSGRSAPAPSDPDTPPVRLA